MRLLILRAVTLLVALATSVSVGAAPTLASPPHNPVITRLSVSEGAAHGGQHLVIVGSDFSRLRSVTFGGTPARHVRLRSSRQLDAVVPAHRPGLVDVRVVTGAGTSWRTVRDRYRYLAAPAVSTIAPRTGPALGGSHVTVRGSNFHAVTAVLFGGTRATAVRVLSPTALVATTPAHSALAVDVRVVGRFGSSTTTGRDRYGYHAAVRAPAVVRPGEQMKVSGGGFRPGTTVRLVLHSKPFDLGTAAVAPDGSFSDSVVVPGAVPDGNHEVIASGIATDGDPAHPFDPVVIDSTPPTVDGAAVSQPNARPGDHVVFTAHVTDNSGVDFFALQVESVSADGSWSPCHDFVAQRISGTATDGIWSTSCDVVPTMLDGTWKVSPWGRDVAGNWVNVNGGPPTYEPQFTVSGATDPGTTPPPTVDSVTASASDLRPGDQFSLDAHFESGVGVDSVELQAVLDRSQGVAALCDGRAQLTTGTPTDGVWRQDCTVPQIAFSGSYTVTPYVEDAAGQFVNTNGPNSSPIRGTFSVSGGYTYGDVARPDVDSITVTPTPAHAGGVITVTAHGTSQVGISMIELQSTADGVQANSSFCDGNAVLISGTDTDGQWRLTCTVPRTVAATSFTVTPYFVDRLGQNVNVNGGPPDDTRGHFAIS